MPEKDNADERDDNAFFDQFFAQRGDRALDQIAPVVSRHNSHAFGQRRFDLLDFLFDTVDDIERVLAVTHHNNPADGLPASVQLGDAAPDIPAEMHRADVLQINRRAVFDFEDDVLNVLDFLDVAAPADVILCGRDLENFSTDVGVAHFDGVDHLAERNVVGNERVWIEIDLVLFYETTNRRDFGHAFHGRERVTEIPILNRA